MPVKEWKERTMVQSIRNLFVLLGLIIAGLIGAGASAQNPPAGNKLRPVEALGMTYEKLSAYLGSCRKDCSQHAKDAKLGHRVTFEVPPYSYTLEGGKVIEVMITVDSFEEFLNEGREKWGAPASLEYQVIANPFGPELRSGTARWDLPGGVVVDARQTQMPGKVVGVSKLKLGGQTVNVTEQNPSTEGAIVIITNPSSHRTEPPKPVHVL
jgi:hypothetical protein